MHDVIDVIVEVSDVVRDVGDLIDQVAEVIDEVGDVIDGVEDVIDEVRDVMADVGNVIVDVVDVVDEVGDLMRGVRRVTREALLPGCRRSRSVSCAGAPELLFFAAAKKSNQKKAASPRDLQLAIGDYAGISTLGILPRVETARVLRAALRVFRCCSPAEVEEIALGNCTLTLFLGPSNETP
jgi:hypothetical protein